jgi:hypothetical protein
VSPQADANGSQTAGAIFEAGKIVQQHTRVAVVGGNGFAVFVRIAFIGAGLIVGQHGSRRFQLVIHLGNSDNITMAGNIGGEAADRTGGLEDFRKQNYRGILPLDHRAKQVGPHWARWRGKINGCLFLNDHLTLRGQLN